MKTFICRLTEIVTDQVLTDFDSFGAKITWVSKALPQLVFVETEKTKEELERFFLIESAEEDTVGEYHV